MTQSPTESLGEPTPAEEAQTDFANLLNESVIPPTPPGIDEEVANLLAERYPTAAAPESETPSSETVEPTEAVETPAPTPEVSPPLPPADQIVLDDGTIITKDEAASYASFEKFLTDNPDITQAITEAIQSRSQPAPIPPPDNVDLEDPTVQYLIAQNEAVRQQLAEATALIQRHDYQLSTQTEVNSAAIVDQAVNAYQSSHDFSNDEIQQIRSTAASLSILPSLISQGLSPNEAVIRSLDIAAWSIDDFRNKEIQRQYDANRADQEKKSKLASLGGASGAISREPPVPTSKEEIRSAMIREVAEHMGVPPSQS